MIRGLLRASVIAALLVGVLLGGTLRGATAALTPDQRREAAARADIAAGKYLDAMRIYVGLSFDEGHKNDFRERLLRRLTIDATDSISLLDKARALRWFGQEGKAEQIYKALAKRYPGSSLILCEQAMAKLESGDAVAAQKLIASAARLQPGSAYVPAARGAVLQAAGKSAQALAEYDKALAISPWMGGLRQRRALIAYLGKGFDPRGTPINAPIGAGYSAKSPEGAMVIGLRLQHQAALREFPEQIELAGLEWDMPSLGFPWHLGKPATAAPPRGIDATIKACQARLTRGDMQGAIAKTNDAILRNNRHLSFNQRNDLLDVLFQAYLVIGDYRNADRIFENDKYADDMARLVRSALRGKLAWQIWPRPLLASGVPDPNGHARPHTEGETLHSYMRLWNNRLAHPKTAEDYLMLAWGDLLPPHGTYLPGFSHDTSGEVSERYCIQQAVQHLQHALDSPSLAAGDPMTAATFPVDRAAARRVIAQIPYELVAASHRLDFARADAAYSRLEDQLLRLVRPQAINEAFERYEVSEAMRQEDEFSPHSVAARADELALRFRDGRGVPQDDATARKLFQQAGDFFPGAWLELGKEDEFGRGTKKDLNEAISDYERAAAMGSPQGKAAADRLSTQLNNAEFQKLLKENHGDVNMAMTIMQVLHRKKKRQATGFFSGFVSGNYPTNNFRRPIDIHTYDHGLTSIRDEADRGNANAQWLLGERYMHGIGVKKDTFAALLWYDNAAEQNQICAQFALGKAYFFGQGLLRDPKQARQWLRKADRDGDPFFARYLLALLRK